MLPSGRGQRPTDIQDKTQPPALHLDAGPADLVATPMNPDPQVLSDL